MTSEVDQTAPIRIALAAKGLLPANLSPDAGDLDAGPLQMDRPAIAPAACDPAGDGTRSAQARMKDSRGSAGPGRVTSPDGATDPTGIRASPAGSRGQGSNLPSNGQAGARGAGHWAQRAMRRGPRR
jgi:hypothetical protein